MIPLPFDFSSYTTSIVLSMIVFILILVLDGALKWFKSVFGPLGRKRWAGLMREDRRPAAHRVEVGPLERPFHPDDWSADEKWRKPRVIRYPTLAVRQTDKTIRLNPHKYIHRMDG
jgi:hypothetical protein